MNKCKICNKKYVGISNIQYQICYCDIESGCLENSEQ